MNIKLVSLTQSVITDKQLNAEELIVYIARVSNPLNQLNTETAPKLIKYMVEHNHWSPFEMCDMTVEITTSRAIAQQMLRHRSFSFQEFSQRYSEVSEYEPIHLRKSGTTNRQSSLEKFNPNITETTAQELIKDYLDYSDNLYQNLLSVGVAKECARMVLPLTTQTTLYMKGSIRSWIHYLQIRREKSTQLEHREIAEQILAIFKNNFPIISKSLNI